MTPTIETMNYDIITTLMAAVYILLLVFLVIRLVYNIYELRNEEKNK